MSCSRTSENLTPQKCPGTFPKILSTNLLRLLRDANIFDLNIHTLQNSANAESLNVKYLPDEDENSCCVCEASQAGTDLWMGKILLIELMRIYMAS